MMPEIKIGNYVMHDLMRMMPKHWAGDRDTSVIALPNGGIRVERDDWTFVLEGDGIVRVSRNGRTEVYDEHGYYAYAGSGTTFFLLRCMELWREVEERHARKRANAIAKDAKAHIDSLYGCGAIDFDTAKRLTQNLGPEFVERKYQQIMEMEDK